MEKNFKTKLLLELLKLRQARDNNQGVALFAVICLILVGVVVGSTLLINSFRSKEGSISQEQKSKSFYLAESGANRTITLLNQSSGLADRPSSQWSTLVRNGDLPTNNSLCAGVSATNARNELVRSSSRNGNSLGTGKYKILDYGPDTDGDGKIDGNPTLKIEGLQGEDGDNSSTVLELQLPLVPYPTSLVGDVNPYYYYGVYYQGETQTSGIWLKQGGTASLPRDSVNSDISYECSVPNNSPSTNVIFSPLWITSAIPTNTGFEILDTDLKMPEEPTAQGPNLGSWTSSNTVIELPRSGDQPDDKGRYHYQLTEIDIEDGNFKLKIPHDKKVVLHVTGDIEIVGNTPSATSDETYTVSCENNSKYVDTALNDISILEGENSENIMAATRLQIYAGGNVTITNATVTGLIYVYEDNKNIKITGGSVQGGIWTKEITVNNSNGCRAGVIQAAVDDQSDDNPDGTLAVWDEVESLFVGAPISWKFVKSN